MQACSAAARVPPRSPSPGAPLLRVLVLCLRYEASSLPEGGRRRIRLGSVLPSSRRFRSDSVPTPYGPLRPALVLPSFACDPFVPPASLASIFGFVRVYAVVWRYSGPLLWYGRIFSSSYCIAYVVLHVLSFAVPFSVVSLFWEARTCFLGLVEGFHKDATELGSMGSHLHRCDRTCLPGRDCVPLWALVSQSLQ